MEAIVSYSIPALNLMSKKNIDMIEEDMMVVRSLWITEKASNWN